MQIERADVIPIELKLRQPVKMARVPQIESLTAIFLRLETVQGQNAWGCAVAHPDLTGEKPADVTKTCMDGARLVPDLHPTNLEYSLSELEPALSGSPAALCAFDMAFHDMLGLASGLPLYRIMGGYRTRIQTSITIPLLSAQTSVELAHKHARSGFRILKIKGGVDPESDVNRIKSISRALPNIMLRLDADGGYTVQQALDVTRALEGKIEMLEQPTDPDDLDSLLEVTRHSAVPILVDQSVSGPASALEIAAHRNAHGMSIKIATCGGLRCARQIDAIARAAQMTTMVSCVLEPALLIAAGLNYALSSPTVGYADLDGHIDLVDDPTIPGFRLEDGWLIATDSPGLGCTVDL